MICIQDLLDADLSSDFAEGRRLAKSLLPKEGDKEQWSGKKILKVLQASN